MGQPKKIATGLAAVEAFENQVSLRRFQRQTENLERLLERLATALEELESTKEALGLADLRSVEFGIDFYEEVRSFEIALIRRALRAGGSQKEAAALLKLRQQTLNMKIQRYKLVARSRAAKKGLISRELGRR